MNGRSLSPAEVEQRRAAGFQPVHGAKSASAVAARAKMIASRFLREQKLKRADLDGIARAYLDGWARATAKVELWDEHDPLGAGSREYIAASNSARLFMAKLEQRLRVLGRDRAQPAPGSALREHIERNYRDGQP